MTDPKKDQILKTATAVFGTTGGTTARRLVTALRDDQSDYTTAMLLISQMKIPCIAIEHAQPHRSYAITSRAATIGFEDDSFVVFIDDQIAATDDGEQAFVLEHATSYYARLDAQEERGTLLLDTLSHPDVPNHDHFFCSFLEDSQDVFCTIDDPFMVEGMDQRDWSQDDAQTAQTLIQNLFFGLATTDTARLTVLIESTDVGDGIQILQSKGIDQSSFLFLAEKLLAPLPLTGFQYFYNDGDKDRKSSYGQDSCVLIEDFKLNTASAHTRIQNQLWVRTLKETYDVHH